MADNVPVVVFIGGGPRTAGLLERMAANRPELLAGPLIVHVVEPYEAGSGRIWRFDQSPLLLLNSMAGDITMFTDESVNCSGPAVTGPSLVEWAAGVLDGSIPDAPVRSAQIRDQLRHLSPQSFPTRQLHSHYLQWFFRRAVTALGPEVTVQVHQDTAVSVDQDPSGAYRVRLAGGRVLGADVLVCSLGHTDAAPGEREDRFASFADRHGGFYASPSYTQDVDYSALRPGEDVLVSGMGLAFVDLMVLLMEGRGGRFTGKGSPLTYHPSGQEPVLWVGSRRGVPYHSKITSALRGTDPGVLQFLTDEAVQQLLEDHEQLSFFDHLWPLVLKECGHGWYREILTGYPERATMSWPDFQTRYAPLDWFSPAREDLVRQAVPDPGLHLDLEDVDTPFAGRLFADHHEVQQALVDYIRGDLTTRTSPDHSETLALFLSLLRVYMEIGRLVPTDRLDDASRRLLSGWWHGFFSFVDSGPPPHRLQELLALHRAGFVHFLGPQMWIDTDEDTGRFRAGSAQSPVVVTARALIEARLPAPAVTGSANPLLTDLAASGTGAEQSLAVNGQDTPTGKLLITADHRLVGADGRPHRKLFAVGPGTSDWTSGAFARPRTNAAVFRDNDAVARSVLEETNHPSRRHHRPEPSAGRAGGKRAPGNRMEKLYLPLSDPRVRPLLEELAHEYSSRYGDLFGDTSVEMNRYPAAAFAAPDGALLILQENGTSVAGGAFRRWNATTAELKRIWTHSRHRRRGLARIVLAELEREAARRGYTRLHLTTGPRQPEARSLYLATGYTPLFDLTADPEQLHHLAFGKDLARPTTAPSVPHESAATTP